jgi:hypothetical protein
LFQRGFWGEGEDVGRVQPQGLTWQFYAERFPTTQEQGQLVLLLQ